MARRDLSLPTIISVVLCVIFLGLTVFFVMGQTNGKAEFEQAYAENEATLLELQEQLDGIAEVTAEEVVQQVDLHSALEAGEAVAKLQEEYQVIPVSMDSIDKLETVASSLDVYLADDSNEARTPWYSPSTLGVSVEFDWRFETTYSFSGSKIPVLWTCWDADGNLCAYCTAVYESSTGLFSNVEFVVTSIGSTYVNSDESIDDTTTMENVDDTEVVVEDDATETDAESVTSESDMMDVESDESIEDESVGSASDDMVVVNGNDLLTEDASDESSGISMRPSRLNQETNDAGNEEVDE